MTTDFILSLRPDVVVLDGDRSQEIALSFGSRRLRYRRPRAGIRTALGSLSGKGCTFEDLVQSARGSDPGWDSFRIQLWLDRLAGHGLLSHSVPFAEGMLATAEAVAPGYRVCRRPIDAGTPLLLSRFACLRAVDGRVRLESPYSPARIVLRAWQATVLVTLLSCPRSCDDLAGHMQDVDLATIQLLVNLLVDLGVAELARTGAEVEEETRETVPTVVPPSSFRPVRKAAGTAPASSNPWPEVGTRLMVAPDAAVQWCNGRTVIGNARSPSVVEADDVAVLLLLQEFSSPADVESVLLGLGDGISREVLGTLRILVERGILIEVGGPRRLGAPSTHVTEKTSTHGQDDEEPTVFFVHPPDLGRYGSTFFPPAGILFLASLARREGWATEFMFSGTAADRRKYPGASLYAPLDDLQPMILVLESFVDEVLERIERLHEHGSRVVLAISCFSSTLYSSTMLLAAAVRNRFGSLPIVVGGYHPTIDPRSMTEVVGTGIDALHDERVPWRKTANTFVESLEAATSRIVRAGDWVFDQVFVGRADRSFPRLLRSLKVEFKRPEAPSIVQSEPFTDAELKAFRYDESLISTFARSRPAGSGGHEVFPLCLSFGCPYACSFCVQSVHPERWQGLDVDHAVDLIERLHVDFGFDSMSLLDANFGADPVWREKFFRTVAARPWSAEVCLSIEVSVMGFDLEDPSLLESVGVAVQVGAETASPEMLLRMGKTRAPRAYLRKLERMVAELSPLVDRMDLMMIVGFPGETRETLAESFDFLIEHCRVLDHHNIQLTPQVYIPLSGSLAVQQSDKFAKEFGFRSSPVEWWQGEAADRHRGLRPSSGLDLETCATVVGLVHQYYSGGPGPERDAAGRPISDPRRTRAEKERFKRRLSALLRG